MDAEVYWGYLLLGHAIRQDHEYVASGAVIRNNKLVETSGLLSNVESECEAQLAGTRLVLRLDRQSRLSTSSLSTLRHSNGPCHHRWTVDLGAGSADRSNRCRHTSL